MFLQNQELSGFEEGVDGFGRLLAVFHGLHRQVQPAGTAVAARPHAVQAGRALGIRGNAAALQRQAASASTGLPSF